MMDEKKFEGMKRQIIVENEAAYGKELREKYGDEAVEEHTARLSGMSQQEWEQTQADEEGYKSALRRAVRRVIPPGRRPGRPCGSTPRGWHTTGPQGR